LALVNNDDDSMIGPTLDPESEPELSLDGRVRRLGRDFVSHRGEVTLAHTNINTKVDGLHGEVSSLKTAVDLVKTALLDEIQGARRDARHDRRFVFGLAGVVLIAALILALRGGSVSGMGMAATFGVNDQVASPVAAPALPPEAPTPHGPDKAAPKLPDVAVTPTPRQEIQITPANETEPEPEPKPVEIKVLVP
jgi:hypothetical protein